MSEEVKEAGKKKGGKMPVIIAVVAVLAGGGFFMMKSKGGKVEKPAIEIGEIQTMPEFLVNLKDGTTYLRTEIALQMKKGFEKEQFDKVTPAIRDAIVLKLTSKGIDEIRTVQGKDKLKKEIANAVNDSIGDSDETDASKGDSESDKKVKKVTEIHTDWDSQTGPVLKVFFTSFATQ